MEELNSPETLDTLDIRARMLGWNPRERHELVASVPIDAAVPEAVQRLLMTAKNLIVYSCFHYPFNMVAAQTAFSAVELAIKMRCEAEGHVGKLRGLRDAIQRAIDEKWIADDSTLNRPRLQQIVSAAGEVTYEEVPAVEPFVAILARVFPKYRNDLAHGSSIMDNLGANMVLDANRMINQISSKQPIRIPPVSKPLD